MEKRPGFLSHDLPGLVRLSSALLEHTAGDNRKGNVLVIRHHRVPAPDSPCLNRDEHTFGLALCLRQGMPQLPDVPEAMVDCVSHALPFEDGAFRRVILYHVTDDGEEPELQEACRVLQPGGELLIVGLNSRSWSSRRSARPEELPLLQVARVLSRLQEQDLFIDAKFGVGIMGKSNPWMAWNRLSGLLLPLADIVVVRARHNGEQAATRLKLKGYRAGIMPTAISI